MSTVLGTVVIARHGDRLLFPEDPYTYKGPLTESTPFGQSESHQLGQTLRSLYLNPRSDSIISGMRRDLVNTRQIQVYAKNGGEGNVVFDSTIALLQGFFPPSERNELELANGTTIRAPLNGYQYVPIETVEPENDRSLESWIDCPEFKKHIQKFYQSEEFKRKAEEAKPILETFKDYVFGRPSTLENALYDYISTQLTYNQTYAYRLPPHIVENARSLANYHENGIFSDTEPSGIGNIAGRTMLHLVLEALERMGFEEDPLKVSIIGSTYQPMISFFHEIEAVKETAALKAIQTLFSTLNSLANFSSAITIELRQTAPPDIRPMIRLRFKNGTEAGWETLHAYGHHGDIPLTEFFYRAKGGAISNNRQWAQVCGVSGDGSRVAEESSKEGCSDSDGWKGILLIWDSGTLKYFSLDIVSCGLYRTMEYHLS
ncbi:phosphoglycerate mutase-like protein [Marasmius fiardii PR-910]|nr:phosphoglycerate mutase-like protein [Marasmius fiardii PR-910]